MEFKGTGDQVTDSPAVADQADSNGISNVDKKENQQLFTKFFHYITLDSKLESEEAPLYDEEPHTQRRKEILQKHPEIKKLMGYDPNIAFLVSAEVLMQILVCWLVQDASWATIIILAYCCGGILNHSLALSIHEISHNLAYGHGRNAWLNRVLSIWCNLPLGIPLAITYKKYHADHHRYLGEETNDVDVPTRLEAYLFRHPLTKLLWIAIFPFIQGLRPFFKNPKPITQWEIINFISVVFFNSLVFVTFGAKALQYLLLGTLLGMGLHPFFGHFVSEHYAFQNGQATHSYYGPLNRIFFNVGYHNEHHDFPYIPCSRLPEVTRLAPEFYTDLPCHTSSTKVLWDFVFDSSMGPHSHTVSPADCAENAAVKRKTQK